MNVARDPETEIVNDTNRRLINSAGAIQPNLAIFPPTFIRGRNRQFIRAWYDTYPMIEYSVSKDKAFCFSCRLFDKPGSIEKATENLKLLSGKVHFQHSGVCLYKNGESLWEYSEVVKMKMHNLSEEEIVNYVKLENPIHAAGAYKFESLGCNLFSSVDGSSYTVRGMPLLPLLNALREMKVLDLTKSV